MLIFLSAVSFFVGFDNVDILSREVGIVNYYLLFNCFFRVILLFTQVLLSNFLNLDGNLLLYRVGYYSLCYCSSLS